MRSFDRVVVLGRVADETVRDIRAIAEGRKIPVERWSAETDVAAVASLVHPLAVVVDTDDPFAVLASLTLRQIPGLGTTPIMGLARRRCGQDFLELFALGGDDLLDSARVHQLGPRLDALLDAVQSKRARMRGKVVLASTETRWLPLVRTIFARAGYDVAVAADADEAPVLAMSSGARVIVVGPDLSDDPSLGERLAGSRLSWVLACTDAVASRRRRSDRVRVVDRTMPPETLVAAANELLFAEETNKRTSPRLPFATPIAFRPAGQGEDDVGFCHNLSAGGFYVRTLAPPDRGEDVWIEMLAPTTERYVRLLGTVMWKRAYSRDDATAPSGFGVQLREGLGADLETYVACYQKLLAEATCDPGPLSQRLAVGSP